MIWLRPESYGIVMHAGRGLKSLPLCLKEARSVFPSGFVESIWLKIIRFLELIMAIVMRNDNLCIRSYSCFE